MAKNRREPMGLDSALLATKLSDIKAATGRSPFDAKDMAPLVPGSPRRVRNPAASRHRRSTSRGPSSRGSRRRRSPSRRRPPGSSRATPARSLQPPHRRPQPRKVGVLRSPSAAPRGRSPGNASPAPLSGASDANVDECLLHLGDGPKRTFAYKAKIWRGDMSPKRYATLCTFVEDLLRHPKSSCTRMTGNTLEFREFGIFYLAKVIMNNSPDICAGLTLTRTPMHLIFKQAHDSSRQPDRRPPQQRTRAPQGCRSKASAPSSSASTPQTLVLDQMMPPRATASKVVFHFHLGWGWLLRADS